VPPAYFCEPEQVSAISRTELTRRVGLRLELMLPPAVDGLVVDGLAVEPLLLESSIVPLISTLWFTYFDRSSLAVALSFSPWLYDEADEEPVVPAVLGLVVVPPAVVELEPPIDTLFNTN
jgi:hypothetical protein